MRNKIKAVVEITSLAVGYFTISLVLPMVLLPSLAPMVFIVWCFITPAIFNVGETK